MSPADQGGGLAAPSPAGDMARGWTANPQTRADHHGAERYDGESHAHWSREFFERADATMLEWNRNLHTDAGPFGSIFPYARYAGDRVLEIGCGMGAMASMWASRGARVTAVDLNPAAVAQTRRRFELSGLDGDVRRSDGRLLPFADSTFDYVYSWGALDHSPDVEQSIAQLVRVLKPGGEFGVRLYHRHSLLYWYHVAYLEGLVHGEGMFLDDLTLATRYADDERAERNPHPWPITRGEAHALFRQHVGDVDVRVLGTDLDGILANEVAPVAWRVLPRVLRKSLARRFGWSLWITGTK